MIDLDEEFARVEAMLARRERMALGVTCTEMIELITRLRQAEKDAARYRWLRHMADVDGATEMMLAILISDDWDAAIDEVMNGSNN